MNSTSFQRALQTLPSFVISANEEDDTPRNRLVWVFVRQKLLGIVWVYLAVPESMVVVIQSGYEWERFKLWTWELVEHVSVPLERRYRAGRQNFRNFGTRGVLSACKLIITTPIISAESGVIVCLSIGTSFVALTIDIVETASWVVVYLGLAELITLHSRGIVTKVSLLSFVSIASRSVLFC